MIWYVCLFIGIALILLGARVAFKKSYGRMRIAYTVLFLALATYVIYIPLFFTQYDFFTALLGGLINILRVISLDTEYEVHYPIVTGALSIQFFSKIYMTVLGIIQLVLPAVSLFAAYNILLRFFSSAQLLFVSFHKRPLFIFSDLNEDSLLLAKSIKDNVGKCDVVFACCDDQEKKQDLQKYYRFILHQDKLETIPVKRKSKKKVYYFCIAENENDNLNLALMLLSRYENTSKQIQKNTRIYLFSEQKNLDVMIDSAQKGSIDLRPVNRSESIAYMLLDTYPLYESAKDKKITLLLYGAEKVNRAILKAASWCGQLYGYKLKINVVGMGADDFEDELKLSCPDFFNGDFDFSFYRCENNNDGYQIIRRNCSDATYIVVCTGNDGENIEMSLCLRRFFYENDRSFSNVPPIFTYIESSEKFEMVYGLKTSESKPERRVSYGIIPFGNNKSVYSYDNIINSRIDSLAKNVHLVYEDIFSDGEINAEEAIERYNLLEVNKRSNRANAMHIRYKLSLLGLDYSDDKDAEEVELSDYLDPDTVEKLTYAEHDRWMAFLQSEGWVTASLDEVERYKAAGISAGRHNCPLLKKHPYICPFKELSERSEALGLEDSTVYDRELITRIPDVLHDRWNVSGRKFKIIKKTT